MNTRVGAFVFAEVFRLLNCVLILLLLLLYIIILYYKSEGNLLEGGSRNAGEGVFMSSRGARGKRRRRRRCPRFSRDTLGRTMRRRRWRASAKDDGHAPGGWDGGGVVE